MKKLIIVTSSAIFFVAVYLYFWSDYDDSATRINDIKNSVIAENSTTEILFPKEEKNEINDTKIVFVKDIDGGADQKVIVNYSGGIVSSFSIYKIYPNKSDYSLGIAVSVTGLNWKNYPSINFEEARLKLPETDTYVAPFGVTLFFFRDSSPGYVFQRKGDANKLVLVNAGNGSLISIDKNQKTNAEIEREEIEKSKVFLKKYTFMSGEYLQINRQNWLDLSQKERDEMELETKKTNELIQSGVLSIDADFNVVFDKRR